jgi:hypothetical protein
MRQMTPDVSKIHLGKTARGRKSASSGQEIVGALRKRTGAATARSKQFRYQHLAGTRSDL